MDFVVELPETERKNNAIMVVVDRFSKERHYIVCQAGEESISAESTVWLFYQNIWRLYGLSFTIISDRKSQFVSLIWRHFCKILDI